MKLQPRFLAGTRLGGRRQAAAAGVATVETPEALPGANMQALAAELHQAAVQGLFEYPRNLTLVARTVAALAVMLSLMHLALTAIPLIQAPGTTPASLLNLTMLGALLGVVFAGAVAAFAVNLLPSVQVTPQGLGISELTGWRVVPWDKIGVLRVMEMQSNGRYVVFVPFTGRTKPRTPAPMLRWIPALAGAARKGERGLLVFSGMKNCDRLLQLIVAYVVEAAGENPATVPVEKFVDEDVVMPVAQLFLTTGAALSRMARNNEGNTLDPYTTVMSEEHAEKFEWGKVMPRQLPIALLPTLMLVADVLMRDGERGVMWLHWVWAALLFGFGMLELAFMAKLVQAVGEMMVGSGQFNASAWAYLELQMPRAVAILIGAALLGIGLPVGFALGMWFVGIIITTVLLTRFVQKLYYMPLGHTMVATIGTVIFQLSLLALYVGVR